MSPALRYLLGRLASLPLIVLLMVSAAFLLVNVLPGDPVRQIAGEFASAQRIAEVEHELGLDLPLPQRYAKFMGDLAQGDLGTTFYTDRSITEEFKDRAMSSFVLVTLSLLFGAVIGVAVGGVAAYYDRRWQERIARAWVYLFQSTPDFLLGLLLLYFLYFQLRLAPPPVGQLGLMDPLIPRATGAALIDSVLAGNLDVFVSAVRHAALPVLTLALLIGAYVAKLVRTNLGEALAGPAAEFARSCGLPESRVLRYAFKESRTPVLTQVGVLFAHLLGGAAIVEVVFSWGGLGEWGIESMVALDVPVIQAWVVVIGAFTLMVYILVEVLVIVQDPRLSFGARTFKVSADG